MIDVENLHTIVCEVPKTPSVPTMILLVPWGRVENDKGGFIFDETAATETMREFSEKAVEVPIDYEHQTLGGRYNSPTGKAPAAGWIQHLIARPGVGLFGRVSWTPEGESDLLGRKYRYISPVVLVDQKTNRVVALHSAALTNKPAIRGMAAVVNRDESAGDKGTIAMAEHEELLGKLRTLAGLGQDADEAAILARLADLVGGETSANAIRVAVCRELAEDFKADVGEVVAKVRESMRPVEELTVNADHRFAMDRAESAEAELFATQAKAFIDGGIELGKVASCMVPMWLRAFAADPDHARADMRLQSAYAPVSGRVIANASRPPSGGGNGQRQSVINRARVEYEGGPLLRKMTTLAAHVNCALRDDELPPMTETELATIPTS